MRFWPDLWPLHLPVPNICWRLLHSDRYTLCQYILRLSTLVLTHTPQAELVNLACFRLCIALQRLQTELVHMTCPAAECHSGLSCYGGTCFQPLAPGTACNQTGEFPSDLISVLACTKIESIIADAYACPCITWSQHTTAGSVCAKHAP